jgi:hypothetical protein
MLQREVGGGHAMVVYEAEDCAVRRFEIGDFGAEGV